MVDSRITIEYDGAYPNLCSGHLIVYVDSIKWNFGSHCLSSGGYVNFDEDWNEDVGDGPWSVKSWPKGFPEDAELRRSVVSAINDNIEWGCCGGCV